MAFILSNLSDEELEAEVKRRADRKLRRPMETPSPDWEGVIYLMRGFVDDVEDGKHPDIEQLKNELFGEIANAMYEGCPFWAWFDEYYEKA